MFKNYLLVTLRNLYKNKIYALINILGLGMALAICIVAYFNHMFGYDFDRQHEHFREIYRVTSNRLTQDSEQDSERASVSGKGRKIDGILFPGESGDREFQPQGDLRGSGIPGYVHLSFAGRK